VDTVRSSSWKVPASSRAPARGIFRATPQSASRENYGCESTRRSQKLHAVTGVQLFLTIAYAIVVTISAVVAALVIRSTRAKRRADVDPERLAGFENRWGFVVIVLLISALAATIWSLPYDETEAQPGAQRVTVRAQQFGWAIQPARVQVGRPVQFVMTSKDVQHGFGVFDGNKLLVQVQVPARSQGEQRYVYTFDKRGTYEVLCMEFCGFQHHMMRGQLRVE
jgi:cytochrome c oxidase subunit 2